MGDERTVVEWFIRYQRGYPNVPACVLDIRHKEKFLLSGEYEKSLIEHGVITIRKERGISDIYIYDMDKFFYASNVDDQIITRSIRDYKIKEILDIPC